MSAVADTLQALARALDGQGLPWFVFGAQAVAVRGAPRATQDIDVTVQVERTHLRALVEALESEGLRHRYPDLADELLARGAVLPLSHPSGMESISCLPAPDSKRPRSTAPPGWPSTASRFRWHTPPNLAVMKVIAGRGKDLDDLRSLLTRSNVDLAEARNLLGQFEGALAQPDLLPRLEEAVAAVNANRA